MSCLPLWGAQQWQLNATLESTPIGQYIHVKAAAVTSMPVTKQSHFSNHNILSSGIFVHWLQHKRYGTFVKFSLTAKQLCHGSHVTMYITNSMAAASLCKPKGCIDPETVVI